METVLAFVIGGLYAAGIYSMLRRSLIKLVIGLIFLGNASNLLIFTSAGLTRGKPPIISNEKIIEVADYADPLPQAMILTAIVISFGVLAFVLVLIQRAYKMIGSDDIDKMRGK